MISIFELFSIGIGPSSSHTVGPMLAAQDFALQLTDKTVRLRVEVFGSLALTGKGHGTDRAIISGLEGGLPETVDTNQVAQSVHKLFLDKVLNLPSHQIAFDLEKDFIFHANKNLPYHTNGMQFTALDQKNKIILQKAYYSIGGGFILSEDHIKSQTIMLAKANVPFQFDTAAALLNHCKNHQCDIAQIVLENEKHWYTESAVHDKIKAIWQVMDSCIEHGCLGKGLLPGGLKVRRRAPLLFQKMLANAEKEQKDIKDFNWLNIYAMAVNEENAAGHRIVTAPTNGAAGIIPAVLKYYLEFYDEAKPEDIDKFLLTAGGIGILYKKQASISGAEVGCQGEVGVACSMAAGGLAAVLGGTPLQVEQAAEIGMEHHLGLTCDPILGLVQVPCIERNAMAAVHAVNAANIAILEDGEHIVSLDQVIQTMKQTGADMNEKYKETAQGGLAVNVPVC
tara:strand:- start:87280 stop:88635 length:1356 start_codon:yes stop_codon:yes gene_type:complete